MPLQQWHTLNTCFGTAYTSSGATAPSGTHPMPLPQWQCSSATVPVQLPQGQCSSGTHPAALIQQHCSSDAVPERVLKYYSTALVALIQCHCSSVTLPEDCSQGTAQVLLLQWFWSSATAPVALLQWHCSSGTAPVHCSRALFQCHCSNGTAPVTLIHRKIPISLFCLTIDHNLLIISTDQNLYSCYCMNQFLCQRIFNFTFNCGCEQNPCHLALSLTSQLCKPPNPTVLKERKNKATFIL